MAQDVLVTEQIEGGRELLAQLAAEGVEVTVAFWAKETDSGLWYLFIATPMADIHGPGGHTKSFTPRSGECHGGCSTRSR